MGTISGGRFRTRTDTQGQMTEKLGGMVYTLVENYGKKGNWSGYTHVDEMKGDARMKLVDKMLMFSPLKSSNPLAYATSCMQSAFVDSKKTHAKVWKHESNLNYDDVAEDGGRLAAFEKESSSEEADREFKEAEAAFHSSP